MFKIPHFKSYFLASIACLFVVAGCFFKPSPPSPEEQAEKIAESLAGGGYTAERTYTIKLMRDRWLHDGQAIEILILAPEEPGTYPLILYLPGLGEHADGGVIWRENWAKAGYFVMSIQAEEMGNALKEFAPLFPGGTPPEMPDEVGGLFGDKKPKMSNALRTSELRYLGREYSSLKSLAVRMAHLAWAYDQIRQNIKERRDIYRVADLSRVIVAGYEFGAQAVAAMIGEQYETDLPKPENFKPVAAILLSPLVDLSLGKINTRYQKINIPVLSVTSQEDSDTYAMSTPQTFWENVPVGNKFQLLLKYASHQLLSGSHWSSLDQPSEENMHNMPGQLPNFHQLNGSPGQIPDFNQQNGGGGGPPGEGRPPMMGGMPPGGMANGKHDSKQLAAVISVSSAFMDSFAKSDKFATSWLHNSAHRWLKKSGKLLSK